MTLAAQSQPPMRERTEKGMEREHAAQAFDLDLQRLETLIIEMGGLVESQLAAAIEVLGQHDPEHAKRIIAADDRVDRLEFDIDELAVKILALRQPIAVDLRKILASIKIASNLERIGDYAKNLAKRSNILAESDNLESSVESIARMARLVQEMIKNALDAYLNRDSALAEEVRQSDAEVDQIHNSLFRELLTFMIEDPRKITPCTHLLFITKNIERMGDHVTGIAEQVTYVAKGKLPENDRPKEDKTSTLAISLAYDNRKDGGDP